LFARFNHTRNGLKLTLIAACWLWVAHPLTLHASDLSGSVSEARAFASACLSAFEVRRWSSALACVDADSLAHLSAQYLSSRVRPTHKAVPRELILGFGADTPRETLLRMPPPQLLAGALDGGLAAVAENGLAVRELRFKVRRVQHRIRSVYEAEVTAHVAIDGSDPIHLRAQFAIIMRNTEAGWRMDVPITVYELLSLEPPAL